MAASDAVQAFLASAPFAVVGASSDRRKFGNKLLRRYIERGLPVYPVNPAGGEIEGLAAWPSLSSLPEPVGAVSIVTPPAVTEAIVEEAAELGIRHLWMQPGAESARAVRRARELGIEVISGGTCLLVELP